MQKYQNTVLTTNGTPAVGASVEVLNYPSGTLATIYSSLTGTAVTNPLTTNAIGYFSFYAVNGRYTLVVSGANLATTQFTDIILEDTIPLAGTVALGAGASGNLVTRAITGQFGTYPCQMQTACIPGGTLGVNGQADIQFSVTTTNSSSSKVFYITVNGVVVGPNWNITTEVTTTGTLRIRNSGVTNSQTINVLTSDGQSTSSFQTTAFDTTQAMQVIFWGQDNNASDNSANQISLTAFNISYYNPPVLPGPAPLIPGSKVFWGVNSHPGYYPGVTPAQHVQFMQFLGAGILRLDWEGSSTASAIQAIATALIAAGIQVIVTVATTSMNSAVNTAYASEAAAYAGNFSQGQAAALALIPYGITIFEAGNELDAQSCGSTQIRNPAVSGTWSADYVSSPAFFPLFRGAINGTTDGLRAGAASLGVPIQVASNAFTQASIFLSDGLWSGTDPMSGTPGGQPCKWDITNWHTYGGDFTHWSYTGSVPAPQYNHLQYMQNAYGKPIIITEYNNGASSSSWMSTWYNAQAQYNIASVIFYDAFDSPYNIFTSSTGPYDVAHLTSQGANVQNFMVNNPAPR